MFMAQHISGRGYSIAMGDMEQLSIADSPPVKSVSYVTWKYHTDPEFKERFKKYVATHMQKKFAADPEYYAKFKEDVKQRKKERYQTDPEYREKVLQKNRENYRKRKEAALKERSDAA